MVSASLERRQILATYIPRSITAADLNGNGYPDLIFGARKPQLSGPHDAFLYVYWNGPEGLRDDRRTMLPVKSTIMLMVVNESDEIFLSKRPASGIWGGLWSFPEVDRREQAESFCLDTFGTPPSREESWQPYRHTFS